MDRKYCDQHYQNNGDTTLFCRLQLKPYNHQWLHVPCDKTRQDAEICPIKARRTITQEEFLEVVTKDNLDIYSHDPQIGPAQSLPLCIEEDNPPKGLSTCARMALFG